MLLLFDTVQLTIFSYFYCYPIALYYDCQEADQLAIYTAQLRSSTWGRGLTPKTTRLQVQHPNHSATQPPGSLFEFTWQFLEKNVLVYLQALHHQLKTSFLNKQRTSARCLICKCQKELFFLSGQRMERALLLVCWTWERVIVLYSRERHWTLIS